MILFKSIKIGVVGLGYVGLPLAVEFAKKFPVIGFDLNQNRINDLKNNIDINGDLDETSIINSTNLKFTSCSKEIADCNVYIITVPTPIDEYNTPNLELLKLASEMVAKIINSNDVIIFESTVFPGATEEICVPIIETVSELKFNKDFFVGYSPERINPGDKIHTFSKIKKITSGSTPSAANFIDKLYSLVVSAGTFKVSSIKVAEAAKVIENTQRDVNIALMNEFSRIFNTLKIDTKEVLTAASTKWNFIKLSPGFVGGHCISVDPYYLFHKSKISGYFPDIINTARSLNESMPKLVAQDYLNILSSEKKVKESSCLIIGITFKANCSDLRNSKAINLLKLLEQAGIFIDVFDPNVKVKISKKLINNEVYNTLPQKSYDGYIFCVEHDWIIQKGEEFWRNYIGENKIVFDLKSMFSQKFSNFRL